MEPTTPQPQPEKPSGALHTFQSDLERAMDTTEASAVQELLRTAREKEASALEEKVVDHQRRWYSAGAVILCLLAIGAIVYGLYYYRTLTVRVAPTPSVGVFQSLSPINTTETPLTRTVQIVRDPITEGRPFLLPLVDATGTGLSVQSTLSYLGIYAGEPFAATLSLVRLGVLNTGMSNAPFIIVSTPTPELATKEFLLAEPKLLDLVAPILGIDLTEGARDIGTSFKSTYMFNLPVRTLTSTNVDTQEETILLYYGYATDNTIVIATHPTVLKAVYDTIIRQR